MPGADALGVRDLPDGVAAKQGGRLQGRRQGLRADGDGAHAPVVRMRRLLAATPELPPDYPHWGELVGNQTLAERYLQDMAAWRRRYLCNARPSRPA